MTLSRLLTTLLMIAALMSLAGESTGDAQVYRPGTTVASLPDGLSKEGVVWSFLTGAGGSPAPTVLGILTPPQVEPDLPEQHGALWVWCEGPTEATTCSLKVNAFGTPLELSTATWSLQ